MTRLLVRSESAERAIDEVQIYRNRVSSANATSSILRPRLVDLFCGAGGMTLGFTSFGHSFVPVWANDFDQSAVNTYNENFGKHCEFGDIRTLLKSGLDIPPADVVVGGPPCQGFSLLNKGRKRDHRNEMWRPFMDVVERSNASIFVMENVPQLLKSKQYDDIVTAAETLGFQVRATTLCAADYGVAQLRFRAFIIGCKFADPGEVFPPTATHIADESNRFRRLFRTGGIEALESAIPYETVKDAIGGLPSPIGTSINAHPSPMDLHFGRRPTKKSALRYRAIPKEGMNRFNLQQIAPNLTPKCWKKKKSGGTDLFGRLWWDRPSVTIRTEFYKPEKGRYLHPKAHRPITHREAARLQSFPDEFRFCGNKIEVARQIGNAVPPLMASRVADCVYALLVSREMGFG